MDKSFLCCVKGTSRNVEKLVWTRFCFTVSFDCQETRYTVVGHYHGTLWKYNGMSLWCLYASYDVVWRNEVKWFSSNFCLKVGFSCLKTDLPSGIIWWQNQKLALKYVKNVLESKMFSTFEGEWFVNQILAIPVQGEVVLKWFKASKRSTITVNISFSSGLIQHYLSEGYIRN